MSSEPSRRTSISLLAFIAMGAMRTTAWADDDSSIAQAQSNAVEYLKSRLYSDEQIRGMGPSLPFVSDRQLYWPSWLFGSWKLRSKLLDIKYLDDTSGNKRGSTLSAERLAYAATFPGKLGAIGDEIEHDCRYFSTLADNLENNVRVNLGLGVPSAKIIEDRVFNGISEMQAANQLRVLSGRYDPRNDPTRISFKFAPPDATGGSGGGGGGGGGWEKKELFVLNRQGVDGVEDGRPAYYGSETVQGIEISRDAVQVTEYEILTGLRLLPDGDVAGRRRVVVYRAPPAVEDRYAMARTDGSLRIWSSLTKGREWRIQTDLRPAAVAVIDWEVSLRRAVAADGAVCVETPKGYTQCQPPGFWAAAAGGG